MAASTRAAPPNPDADALLLALTFLVGDSVHDLFVGGVGFTDEEPPWVEPALQHPVELSVAKLSGQFTGAPVDAVDLPVEALDRVWAAVDGSAAAATKAAYRSDWSV